MDLTDAENVFTIYLQKENKGLQRFAEILKKEQGQDEGSEKEDTEKGGSHSFCA